MACASCDCDLPLSDGLCDHCWELVGPGPMPTFDCPTNYGHPLPIEADGRAD